MQHANVVNFVCSGCHATPFIMRRSSQFLASALHGMLRTWAALLDFKILCGGGGGQFYNTKVGLLRFMRRPSDAIYGRGRRKALKKRRSFQKQMPNNCRAKKGGGGVFRSFLHLAGGRGCAPLKALPKLPLN